jgi:flagellar P-ring protein precursor FlgI
MSRMIVSFTCPRLPGGGAFVHLPGTDCRPGPATPWHSGCASAGGLVEMNMRQTGFRSAKMALLRCVAMAMLLPMLPMAAVAQVRIKDIADIEGVRDNQLVGYGLVVGLPGTGDRLRSAIFTRQSLVGMLERLGVNTRDQERQLDTRNVAAVMVTANLPAFARPGSRIDVAVSSLGDATNLTGGTLLVAPLLGADGEVYAVAQGALATGAVGVRGQAASVQRGVPTSGRIANGAVTEREVPFELTGQDRVRLSLRNPDLTTAQRVAAVINRVAGAGTATATDPRTVVLIVGRRDIAALMTDIEQLRVEPDQAARVIIEEASGTIVMGSNVRVSQVAIAQGNLTIRVTETPQVSQPGPLSNGETVVVPRTNIEVDDQRQRRLGILPRSVTLEELVRGLNSMGVGPRDLITILQSIKAAGALQAELEIR